MILKVIPPGAKPSDDGLSADQIKAMIKNFHHHPAGGKGYDGKKCKTTRFAHFPIKQIIDQMVANKIVTVDDKISDVLKILDHGVKFYFSQHVNEEDCPAAKKYYIGYNTVVLVNTVLNKTNLWDDMLDDERESPNYVLTTGFDVTGGTDKANLCPPQCTLFGKTL